MAIQTVNYVTGKIGNLVFYKRSDRYFVRTMPAVVKQSVTTKIRSKNFGISARAGRVLRALLQPAIPFTKDKEMQRRLQGAICKWLQLHNAATLPPQTTLAFLSGFNFNEATSIAARLKIQVTATTITDNLLQLQLPAFVPTQAIAAPVHTASVALTIAAASVQLPASNQEGSSCIIHTISYNDTPVPAQKISLTLPVSTGCLVLTVLSLTYILHDGSTETRPAFMPSGVVDARYC